MVLSWATQSVVQCAKATAPSNSPGVTGIKTRTHCCGHIVADKTVSPFSRARNICCGHKKGFRFCHLVSATNVSQLAQPQGTGKRGYIVADTLLLMMFLGLRKLGNICCGHKMFLNKIRNTFCVPDTKFARGGKRGGFCVGNNVSATMCPRLAAP